MGPRQAVRLRDAVVAGGEVHSTAAQRLHGVPLGLPHLVQNALDGGRVIGGPSPLAPKSRTSIQSDRAFQVRAGMLASWARKPAPRHSSNRQTRMALTIDLCQRKLPSPQQPSRGLKYHQCLRLRLRQRERRRDLVDDGPGIGDSRRVQNPMPASTRRGGRTMS